LILEVVVYHFNRLSISIAGTAAVALVSLPLRITPANASRVSQATTSNIEIMEPLSNAQKVNEELKIPDRQALRILRSLEKKGFLKAAHESSDVGSSIWFVPT